MGLPPASKNVDTWPLKRSFLQQSGLRATPELISETKAFMRAMLTLRYSSPLFRLRSADAILKQVRTSLTQCFCARAWPACRLVAPACLRTMRSHSRRNGSLVGNGAR